MKPFFEIFKLELLALFRSRALAILTAVNAAWMLAMPFLVKSDGTAEGARQIYVRYSLGVVFAVVVVSLAAAAAGSLAKDRAAKRLQLTQIRPVRYFTIALGRTAALAAVAAAQIFLAAAILLCKSDCSRPCSHVLSPVMESPRAEAEKRYDEFMSDPETPDYLRRQSRRTIVAILEQKAADRYESIPAGAAGEWNFDSSRVAPDSAVAVRIRLTNNFDSRDDVNGFFTFAGLEGAVTNITQSVLRVPLRGALNRGAADLPRELPLTYMNRAKNSMMLRPRQDINLLVEADSFALNTLRAALELTAMATVVIAFAMFLGASLGRSVAVFTVMALLFVSIASPIIVEEYPNELDASSRDKVGLFIARFAGAATRPFAALSPLSHLAEDECIERGEVVSAIAGDILLLPFLFSLAAAFILPRKQEN